MTIAPQTLTAQHHFLLSVYGGLWSMEQLHALGRSCEHLDDTVFEDAIERHVHNTMEDHDGRARGSWAPKPADILHHAHAIEAARQQQRQDEINQVCQEIEDSADLTDIEVPPNARQYFQGRSQAQVRRGGRSCRHCSDKGLARFYYDPQDRRRVWMVPEYQQLPEGQQERLRIAACVLCDCQMGQLKEPQFRGAIRNEKMLTMRGLRALSDRRKHIEADEIGARYPIKENSC